MKKRWLCRMLNEAPLPALVLAFAVSQSRAGVDPKWAPLDPSRTHGGGSSRRMYPKKSGLARVGKRASLLTAIYMPWLIPASFTWMSRASS
jgi:hypothetical protein